MTEQGELVFDFKGKIAQLDDRDVAQLMGQMELDGQATSDEALMEWLEGGAGQLTLRCGPERVALQRLAHADIAAVFGFVRLPQAAAAA